METVFKNILVSGTVTSVLLVSHPLRAELDPNNIKIADASSDVKTILNRLNELESEVNSLKKLLKKKTELVESNKVKDKGKFYISSGLGFTNDPEMVDSDKPGTNNRSVNNHFNTSELDGKWSAEFALGYEFNKNIRGELSYAFNMLKDNSQSSDANGGTGYLGLGMIDTHSLFASLYYDFPNKSKFTPYFGGGIGTTLIDVDSSNLDRKPSDLTFGYQGKLGLSYEMMESTDLFLEGIYQTTESFKLSSYVSDPIDIYSTRLGLRYKF